MSDPRYDVFLSHNSKDKPAVERIGDKLRQLGIEPWLDKWHLAAGKSFQDGIEAGLRAAGTCAVFYGPHGPGAWQKAELEVAQDRAVKDPDSRLFLVLLPGVPEPFDATALPAFLNMRTWVDLRTGYEDTARFQPLVNAIAGIPLGPTAVVEADDTISPYRGLQVFDEEHAEFFFGREADVQRLLEKLKTSRFLAVVGPSGSGKSSLVRAGLLPALRNGSLPGSHDWPVRVFKPGARPLDALAAQLAQLDPERPMGRTLDELRDSPRTLDLAATLRLDGRPATTRLVLVIDQFEEIFTLCHSEEERVAFLDNLLHAATVLDGRCLVILTLRADFYPRCAAYPELAALMSAHQALVEPARRVGLTFEPGLVETIVGDVGREPGALPLLEHALLEVWERRQGTMLTLAGYRESGGVGRAIANRADTIFESLAPNEQAVARRILMRLTQPGEQTEDTRRRAEVGELVNRPEERETVERVIDQLVAARLLTAGQDAAAGAAPGTAQVDVAHEALIRAWPRLRGWLDEDREGFLVHNRLAEATQEWERLDRDPDVLYRGARLAEAQALAAKHPDLLNEQERGFLVASVTLRERELAAADERRAGQERQRRRIVAGLAIFSLIALLLAGTAGLQWRAADAETRRADIEAALAVAARATAEARGTVAAAQRNNAQESSFSANVARSTAEAAREAAETQRGIADTERDNAIAQSTAAALARDDALAQERIARSRQLAAQARTAPNADLALLLSLESIRLDPESAETRGSLLNTLAANPDVMAVLPAHDRHILGLAFSPDGSRVATAGADGKIQVWDTASLNPIGPPLLDDPAGAVGGLAFSPDGTMLVSGGDFGALLWDLTSPTPTPEPLLPNLVPLAVAFSPDGALVAATGGDGVYLWDVATRARAGEVLRGHEGDVAAVAFSPDGELLASAADDNMVVLWEVATREQAGAISLGELGIPWTIAFSPDGELLATGSGDGSVTLWEVATGTQSGEPLRGHEAIVQSVVFSPEGSVLASASSDGSVAIWDLATRELWREPLRGHDAAVTRVAFSPDNLLLASAAEDGRLILWDLTLDTALSQTLVGHQFSIHGVAFSPDGELLATADDSGDLLLWDVAAGEPAARQVPEHTDPLWGVAFSPDQRWLAAGTDTGVVLWNLTADDPVPAPLAGYEALVRKVAFSPDGALVLAGTETGVAMWDVATGAMIVEPGSAGNTLYTWGIAFSPDGSRFASSGDNGLVLFWDTATGDPIGESTVGEGSGVLAVDFGPDGQHLVQAGTSGTAVIIDVATGDPAGEPFRITDGIVFDIAFSHDGSQIAAAGSDGTIVLWDIARQAPIGEPLAAHSGIVWNIAFSPDGAQLASVAQDGAVVLHDITVEGWQARACDILHGNMDEICWVRYRGDEPYNETCPDEDPVVIDPAASPVATPVDNPEAIRHGSEARG